jgi:7-cyano-7-deazaguanine synthase in queuosine biosynthesis
MPRIEHLVLCGGADGRRYADTKSLRLNLHGPSENVHLKISDISERLVTNIPNVLIDLLEIASYIYAADSAISRGGPTDEQFGKRWRRKLRFVIPVRQPDTWSSDSVLSSLVETLNFLSDDDYVFEFRSFSNPPALKSYFEFSDTEASVLKPDEVMLFSGGLDSLAGAIEQLTGPGKIVALVSHRSSSKISAAQDYLVTQLRSRFGANRVLNVPIRANLKSDVSNEPTHRTRSFLFAALGAATARCFGKNRILLFENGMMSLNLPPVAQVVGARASRTTHPQALAGFGHCLTNLIGHAFSVDNPFIWQTKSDVIEKIATCGGSELIPHTRSCTRVREMTRLHSHCGRCSQCIDRRFAILAAGQEDHDPPESYNTHLFEGTRRPGPDREIALAFVRSATVVKQMTDMPFFANYGEASRVVAFFPEPEDTVAGRIFDLHQRHAAAVCRVFDQSVAAYAGALRQGDLPQDCLLRLVLAQRQGESNYATPGSVTRQTVTTDPKIRIAIDAKGRRVVFERWGEIKGVIADLLISLAEPFRIAMRDEIAPEHYPFITTSDLMSLTKCDAKETFRRRILRCRTKISEMASAAGYHSPSVNAVIESLQWHGYRLNPDSIRIVAESELSGRG